MRGICYVSMPFGVKQDADGRTLNFDDVYENAIVRAVQGSDMDPVRMVSARGLWQPEMFARIISSPLMIADLTTWDANVLYQVGLRHALRSGRTILIAAAGERLPGDLVLYARVLLYETEDEAYSLYAQLKEAIRQSQRTIIDSPIYQFFPDLQVILPPELESERRSRRAPPATTRRGFAQSVVESPTQAIEDLRRSEEEVRGAPEAGPAEYLNLLQKYRALSQWDSVVALADDAPPDVANSFEVQQLLALALNRRGAPGDQERAIALMEQMVADTGGDGDTLGILGRIYKERYKRAKARNDAEAAAENHQHALAHYKRAFDKDPKDYYSGVNVVTLLLQRNDDAAQAEIAAILPRVRATLQEKREARTLDFWELVADLQLAVVARDWPAAEEAARQAVPQAPSAGMLEATLRDLRALGEKLTDAGDRNRLELILGILRPADVVAETAR